MYSFGWSRADRGLKWWLDHGQPLDDPRLKLIEQIWGADGHLDWFAAWLYSQDYHYSALRPMAEHFAADPVRVDREWIAEKRREQKDSRFLGPESKHLTVGPFGREHSSGAVMRTRLSGRLIKGPATTRHAVFTTASAWGWYAALNAAAQTQLSGPPGVDWKVDVVVLPIGWMGTFRRSWNTGLWFTGKHRYHSIGN
jgi:hypothetical protein